MSGGILIACIGNIFLGDDGFGVEVARTLRTMELPEGVTVVDYGIRGLDLAYALLDPWQAVVMVDAVARGGEPGTLYRLQPGDEQPAEVALDPHAMDPVRVLNLARSLGAIETAIYIVGCEPNDFGDELEGRMGLSAAVAAVVPEAARMVLELAAQLAAQPMAEFVTTCDH
jgi:hydrogenase maturation protease